MASFAQHHGNMTNDISSPSPTTPSTPAVPADLPDPRPAFAIALDTAADVLDQVTADDADRPTPCGQYDVDLLVRHLVAVLQRVGAVARGEDPFSVPQELDPLGVDHYRAAFDRARADQEATWADDEVLGRLLTLPFGVLPGVAALHAYVSEMTVHTWDLATAIGATVAWDDSVVGPALAGLVANLPAEPRGGVDGIPFDPVVSTPADAAAIDQLVAWTGRNPAWTA